MGFCILFPDSRFDVLDLEREVVGPEVELVNPRRLRFEQIDPGTWARADAVVLRALQLDARAIPYLERARVIVRNGVGFDAVDIEAAGAAGIVVSNVPDYGTTEVADSALATMLAFARGTASLDAGLRAGIEGGWTHLHNVTGRRLRGAWFGVIGLGRIGTASALRARAFGMNVAFYDPWLPAGAELSFGFKRAGTRDELLGLSDVVTIHAPLTEQTRAMIDRDRKSVV